MNELEKKKLFAKFDDTYREIKPVIENCELVLIPGRGLFYVDKDKLS